MKPEENSVIEGDIAEVFAQIDWEALANDFAKAIQPFVLACNEVGENIAKWFDELPDEFKQQIMDYGKLPPTTQTPPQHAKRDLENKRRMARGGKWKAF